jgi:hypothetical protein
MTTYKVNNIRVVDNLVDDADPTKQLKLSLANISTGTTRTLTVPNATTTIVGTDTTQTLTNKTIDAVNNTITNIGNDQIIAGIDAAKIANGTVSNTEFQQLNGITSAVVGISDTQTLTNKTITDATNTVSASNLRTTTTDVIISGATAPTTGQVLTATSATTANWQTTAAALTVNLNNAGTVSTPVLSTLKQWYGRSTSVSGIATFNVTVDGTSNGAAIFNSLSVTTHYIQASAQLDTTSNTAVPLTSIRRVVNGKTLEVNVKTGVTGNIVVGGTYIALQNAQDGCNVYVSIIGV